jgi:hypothetical protein
MEKGTSSEPKILNVCIYIMVEGSDAKIIKCGDELLVDWVYGGEGTQGYKYELKYIPLSELGISAP